MPIHLWLSFDGKSLFAASGEAAVSLRGRALSSEYTQLDDGAELRFGFALLRVSEEAPWAGRGRTGQPGAQRQRLLWALGAGALLLVALAGASLFALLRSSPNVAAPAPSTSVAQTPPPAAAAIEAPAPAEAAVLGSPTAAAVGDAQLAPLPGAAPPAVALGLQAPPPAAADSAQSPLLKPPVAYPQNVANRPVPRVGENAWTISAEWRAQHERHLHALSRATTKLVFLGDSITEGWSVAPSYREHFGKYSPLNLGIANDTTQNVLWRLEHGALDGTHPRVVVLLIGINNLAGGFTAAQTADGVRAIVASIQTHAPAARVLLLGVFPARREVSNPLRQTIKDANQLLAGLASPGRVEFHDFGSCLLEPDGSISKSTLRDFVHPTPEGFARVSVALAPFVNALIPSAAE
jgi:beta-glucosidase